MKNAVIGDKNFPHLQKALDPQAMAPAFEEFFRAEYPDRKLKVDEFRIGRIYHKPGKNCGIIYRLSYRDQESRPGELMFYGKMSANGGEYPQPAKEQPAQWPGCGFWKPVSSWPEMDMVLHTFPYDPKLPYLGQLIEVDFIKRQVEENLSGFGLSSGWKCVEVVPHLGKYRPNKRYVFRCELVLADAANNRRQIVFYSKTYDSQQSRYVFDVLRKIYASSACATGQLSIPRPILHVDSANTFWQMAWEGKNFSSAMHQLGWANLSQTGFVPKIATMLAALQQVEMSELQMAPGPTPAMVIENARGDADDIAGFLPEQQAIVEKILKALEVLAPAIEAHKLQTTIHGTFKIAQILCREDPYGRSELALVDFDSVACGDPLYDVAEFITSLVHLRVSEGIPAALMTESVELFLTGYQNQVPWACDRRRVAWYVVAFLLGKIHSSLKKMRSKRVEKISASFDLVQEWLSLVKR